MKEWYLMCNSSPTTLGGFEDEYHTDFKEIAFAESLNTDIGQTTILYNYDLSESTKIRCIIQGNSADTQLKSMERVGLFIRGTVKAGMYILYENRYWLITGYPSYNGIYEKATLQLCQYKLRWQNEKGKIIERYISASSASKYDIGETGNSTIVLTSDNLTLLLPNDDESLSLYGKRVFIDKRIPPEKVYKITRSDDVLYDYGEEHGGILAFIADKTELNTNTDRQDLRICDYIDINTHISSTASDEIPNEKTILHCVIKGSETLRCGVKRTYTAVFTDKNGSNIENVNFTWNIVSDFEIDKSINGDELILYIEDEKTIDEKFKLQTIVNNEIVSEIIITVTGII